MIKLYLDEDVNILLATLLRSRNIDVVTTLESNMLGATDIQQLTFALSLQAAIVTYNRADFEKLFRECITDGKRNAGVIILVRRNVHTMAQHLGRFCVSHENIADQLFYI